MNFFIVFTFTFFFVFRPLLLVLSSLFIFFFFLLLFPDPSSFLCPHFLLLSLFSDGWAPKFGFTCSCKTGFEKKAEETFCCRTDETSLNLTSCLYCFSSFELEKLPFSSTNKFQSLKKFENVSFNFVSCSGSVKR